MNTMNLVMLASLALLTVMYMARRRNRLKNEETAQRPEIQRGTMSGITCLPCFRYTLKSRSKVNTVL